MVRHQRNQLCCNAVFKATKNEHAHLTSAASIITKKKVQGGTSCIHGPGTFAATLLQRPKILVAADAAICKILAFWASALLLPGGWDPLPKAR